MEISAICNIDDFNAHKLAHPERWKAVFDFLESNRLDSLPVGKHEILPDGEAWASVSEYVPKAGKDCRFESHKEYIDLQYVASGKEMMGVTREELPVTVSYDEVKDIVFYAPEDKVAKYEVADQSRYYVFFPADIHRPCIRVEESPAMVRKIVVKVKY